jgi:hypothetical protein
MRQGWLEGGRVGWGIVVVVLLAGAGPGRAGENDTLPLKELIEQQRRQLEEQQKQFKELNDKLGQLDKPGESKDPKSPPGDRSAQPADPPKDKEDTDKIKKAVADYLKDNPGAGMPAGVQTGFAWGQGFYLRSPRDPNYVKWDDESRIPFELQIRSRLMLGYYFYQPTDDSNHQTGQHQQSLNPNTARFPSISQLEVKRFNLVFQGTALDPDLHYRLEVFGNTRGLPGLQNNKVVQTSGAFDPNTAAAATGTGGGVLVDHGISLWEAWVSYDWHPCWISKGCGPDCPEGTYKYSPTITPIAGLMKPFFGLEEFLGNRNLQFVELSMTDLFFDAEDEARIMGAGVNVKALDDRFFMQTLVTSNTGSFLPNTLSDELPNFIMGFWYDLGGSWNAQKKAYDLFGDCLADIDYSCKPVLRVGGCMNLVPMDRRSLYGDGPQSRIFTMPAAPGGTRLINLLNGDGLATATTLKGAHAVDDFDSYSYTVFAAAKWHGFSLSNEWWIRQLDNFHSAPNGGGMILYTYTDPRTNSAVTALFPNKALIDYGMTLQGGYFVVPKKLELVARWSYVSGDSGDVLGNTHVPPQAFLIPSGVPAAALKGGLERVQINSGAFTNFHQANEYTVGVNYYFKRQFLKWQTDFSIYTGGNPVGTLGQSLGTFLGGTDGYGIRTQLQLMF